MISKSKTEVEELLNNLLTNRRTGYTSKLLELVEETDNSVLVCAVGDKQKIGPRNDKIISISNVSGYCKGRKAASLFIDNHCIVDILQKVLAMYNDIGESMDQYGYMSPEDVDIILDEAFHTHKQEVFKLLDELIESKKTINALTAEVAELEETITNILK